LITAIVWLWFPLRTPALTLLLIFKLRIAVWLWLTPLGGSPMPAFTFDLIFMVVSPFRIDAAIKMPRYFNRRKGARQSIIHAKNRQILISDSHQSLIAVFY
jgi:hypothetical protein